MTVLTVYPILLKKAVLISNKNKLVYNYYFNNNITTYHNYASFNSY